MRTLRAMLCAGFLAGGGVAFAADPTPPVIKPVLNFSSLGAMPKEAVRPRLEAWLKQIGKHDAAKVRQIWSQEASVPNAALATIALGLPDSELMLALARQGEAPANGELPAILKDDKLDPFVRSNLAASYAKQLGSHRLYEEALAAAKLATPEVLIDPASFFFYKAIAEHSLMQREPAVMSIARLLDDVTDAPDRYKVVATMMFFDLQQWSKDDKDLSNITKLMDNSGRRLDLAKGGPQTQDIQKKIVFRLDEKIKQLENQAKQKQQQPGQPGDQSCPNGGAPGNGAPGSGPPNAPMQDSMGGTDSGAGQVDVKKLRNYEAVWGKLPEAERKKITQDFIREMPPKFKPMIEDYFRSLNRMNGFKP
ncbi:MAG: hypothetical protein ACRC8S_16490 [Fimbriiglobus sp.]